MRWVGRILTVLFCFAGVFIATWAETRVSIVYTKHNLSRTGPGTIKALTEDRICIFCHAPHNANPLTPLWNKNIEGINYSLYTPYTSDTMRSPAPPSGPTGSTRLCLSCHDGTIALGQTMQPATKIAMTVSGGIPSSNPSYFGTSLASHHPVSFSYYDALPNTELVSTPPSGLQFYGNGTMQCSSCHDPHDNSNNMFLAVDNVRSSLCLLCHKLNGWERSLHNTSPNTWNYTQPNPWPRTGANTDFLWTTVEQNGCGNCHSPHNAGGPKRLLNYKEEETNCFPCHNGNVATANVLADFQKSSRHQVEASTIGVTANHHETKESPLMVSGHVECVDCHNPHTVNNQAASPPEVSGSTALVSGVSIDGSALKPPSSNFAEHEYEICFKCHASSSVQSITPPIPRVAKSVNTRIAFQTINPSYHPIAAAGKNMDVPSIPSAYAPTLTTSSMMYCTDCHDSDESRSIGGPGPRGPHGSQYSPLIRQQYQTGDNISESPSTYALCYWCHNRTSILSDVSFAKDLAGKGGHSGHIAGAVNAPCSLCHDPHGVQDDGSSGSHTNLINFDTRYVTPVAGNTFPFFTDKGSRSGSCTLVCHGVPHNAEQHAY